MGISQILISGIDQSPLASAEELITFQVEQQQDLLVIIQIVSNDIFGNIANYSRVHIICGSASGYPTNVISLFRISWCFDH
jgi:hypothetical protein